MRVVVVGAGLGGLSAACHLAGRGHEVVVVERDTVPGGRAGLLERDGFRFDTGPTVLTMAGILADTFAAAGADITDHVHLSRVDPLYRACYPDGSTIRVRAGREAMRAELRDVCGPAEAAGFDRFCDWLTELYALEMPGFIDRDFDSPLDLARPLRPAIDLVRLGAFRKLAGVVGDHFADERLRKLFSFQAMYAGLSPFAALAVYCVITYMDTVEGVWFPDGGMHAVPSGLAAAAEKAGATFRYGEPVERIEHGRGTPLRVRLASGERIDADAVVANPDLPEVYRHLVPDVDPPRVVRKGHYSPSCLVWLAGVRGTPPVDAAHHNIHFGDAWRSSFDELLTEGVAMRDPSILVTVPTTGDASLAPDGCSSLYVLEPVPNLDGRIDWARDGGRLTDRLQARVASLGYPTDVVVSDVVDPVEWERRGMTRGTPFALSHRFFQTGPFRPRNHEPRVPGLVFVGSGTVPGVGVPMVLLSGRLAADRVERVDDDRAFPGTASPHPITDGLAGARAVGRSPAEPMTTLEESYARCRELNRRHGTTYYASTFLLPAIKRPHVHALYGFCRFADEIVDDLGPVSTDVRAKALADLGDRFLTDLAAGRSNDPVLKAVVHTAHAFDLPASAFERFLGSMAMDLTVATYETFDDLLGYMDGSAAVIGELMLPILEPTSDDAYEPARALGIAFQLTNFIRDVDEDLDRGRVYLPQQDLRRFGADPWRRVADEPWKALLRFEIARTREWYTIADRGIDLLPPRSARCIAAARRLYSGILDRVEAADHDVFTQRCRVPTWQKLAVVVGGIARPAR